MNNCIRRSNQNIISQSNLRIQNNTETRQNQLICPDSIKCSLYEQSKVPVGYHFVKEAEANQNQLNYMQFNVNNYRIRRFSMEPK